MTRKYRRFVPKKYKIHSNDLYSDKCIVLTIPLSLYTPGCIKFGDFSFIRRNDDIKKDKEVAIYKLMQFYFAILNKIDEDVGLDLFVEELTGNDDSLIAFRFWSMIKSSEDNILQEALKNVCKVRKMDKHYMGELKKNMFTSAAEVCTGIINNTPDVADVYSVQRSLDESKLSYRVNIQQSTRESYYDLEGRFQFIEHTKVHHLTRNSYNEYDEDDLTCPKIDHLLFPWVHSVDVDYNTDMDLAPRDEDNDDSKRDEDSDSDEMSIDNSDGVYAKNDNDFYDDGYYNLPASVLPKNVQDLNNYLRGDDGVIKNLILQISRTTDIEVKRRLRSNLYKVKVKAVQLLKRIDCNMLKSWYKSDELNDFNRIHINYHNKHMYKKEFTYNGGERTIDDLTLSSEMFMRQNHEFNHILNINGCYNILQRLYLAAMSASNYTCSGPQPNALIAGPPTSGKSHKLKVIKQCFIPNIVEELTTLTEGAMKQGENKDGKIIMMHEFQEDMIKSSTVTTFKNLLAEKKTSGERLEKGAFGFEPKKFKASVAFTFLSCTNTDSYKFSDAMKQRIVIEKHPINLGTVKPSCKWSEFLNNVSVQNLFNNQKLLSHMIAMIDMYIQAGIIQDVELSAVDAIVNLVKEEIRKFELDIDIKSRRVDFLKCFCRVLVFKRAIELEFSNKTVTFDDNTYLKLEQYLYCTTDIAFIVVSLMVNNLFDPFDRAFLGQLCEENSIISIDAEGDWIIEDASSEQYFTIELRDDIPIKCEERNLQIYAKDVKKKFNNFLYSEQDVIDFFLKFKRLQIKGKVCIETENYGLKLRINRDLIDFYKDASEGDKAQILLENIAKRLGNGICSDKHLPSMLFRHSNIPNKCVMFKVPEASRENIPLNFTDTSDVSNLDMYVEEKHYEKTQSKVIDYNNLDLDEMRDDEHDILFEDEKQSRKRSLSYEDQERKKRQRLNEF